MSYAAPGLAGPNSVETYISYLRKKVDRVEPRLLQTVRGFGYTIRATDAR